MLEGLAAITPLVPRPDSETICGLLVSESAKFSVAVRVPVAVGPKRMLAVQLAPAASVAPQVLLNTVKSPGLVPLKVMPLILIAAVPGLVRVMTFCPPLDPIVTAAQLTLAGDTVAASRYCVAARAQNSASASFARFERFGSRWIRTVSESAADVRGKLAGASCWSGFDAYLGIILPRGLRKGENQYKNPIWKASSRFLFCDPLRQAGISEIVG